MIKLSKPFIYAGTMGATGIGHTIASKAFGTTRGLETAGLAFGADEIEASRQVVQPPGFMTPYLGLGPSSSYFKNSNGKVEFILRPRGVAFNSMATLQISPFAKRGADNDAPMMAPFIDSYGGPSVMYKTPLRKGLPKVGSSDLNTTAGDSSNRLDPFGHVIPYEDSRRFSLKTTRVDAVHHGWTTRRIKWLGVTWTTIAIAAAGMVGTAIGTAALFSGAFTGAGVLIIGVTAAVTTILTKIFSLHYDPTRMHIDIFTYARRTETPSRPQHWYEYHSTCKAVEHIQTPIVDADMAQNTCSIVLQRFIDKTLSRETLITAASHAFFDLTMGYVRDGYILFPGAAIDIEPPPEVPIPSQADCVRPLDFQTNKSNFDKVHDGEETKTLSQPNETWVEMVPDLSPGELAVLSSFLGATGLVVRGARGTEVYNPYKE